MNKDQIISIAASSAAALCSEWLPDGKLQSGHEWVARNPTRADTDAGSFKICVGGGKAGKWADFATGDRGANMITLFCYLNRLDPSRPSDYSKALRSVGWLLGIDMGS